MKKSFLKYLILIAICGIVCSCGPSDDSFIITGKIEGMNGLIYLYDMTGSSDEFDTINIKKERFELEKEISHPTTFIIVYENAVEQVFFAEGGNSLKFSASVNNLKGYEVTGNEANELMNNFRKEIYDLDDKQKIKEIATKYIKEHTNSAIAPYLLEKYFIQEPGTSQDEIEKTLAIIEKVQSNNIYLKSIRMKINGMKRGQKGATLPDVDLVTQNKDTINLKKLDCDYTVVYFWASWLHNKNGLVSKAKKFAIKNQDKNLKVVGINLDGEEYSWKNFLFDDEGEVIHCHEALAWESEVVKKFGIQSLPYFILADKNKKIITYGDNLDALQDGLEPTTP